MEMMKAAILKDYSPHFEIEEVPKPVIERPDEVIAKVLVCSICGTDVGLSTRPGSSYGDMVGRILGHEIVGEVTEVGPAVTSVKVLNTDPHGRPPPPWPVARFTWLAP